MNIALWILVWVAFSAWCALVLGEFIHYGEEE